MEQPATTMTDTQSSPNTSQDARMSDTQLDAPDRLTELHLAVICNDRDGLRNILSTKEYGVDARTSNGATPLMLACLFGRTYAFHCLVKKRASTFKTDHQGLSPLDYVKHAPSIEDTFEKYQAFTGQQPSHSGRQTIYSVLKTAIQAAHNQQRSETKRAKPETMPSATVPVAPVTQEDKTTTVFLRDGDLLQIAQARILKSSQFSTKLGAKSCGAIRAQSESEYLKLAVSGWSGDKAEGALCNQKYTAAVRQLCKEYKFRLPNSVYDYRFGGDLSERSGVYFACHAEKLLAVWVLEECIFETTQTREVHKDTIANLKILIDQVPPRLRDTMIDLDHKPCHSCINFLKLIHEKSGLRIQCSPKTWFIRGKRPQCRLRLLQANGTHWENEGTDIVEDEIDEDFSMISRDFADGDGFVVIESSPPSPPLDKQVDGPAQAASAQPPPLSAPNTPFHPSAKLRRTRQLKEASSPSSPYSKHASPVREWPSPSAGYRSKTLKNVSHSRAPRPQRAASAAGAGPRMSQYLYNPPPLPARRRDRPQQEEPEAGGPAEVAGASSSSSSPASSTVARGSREASPEVIDLSSPVRMTTGVEVTAPEEEARGAEEQEEEDMLDSSILDRPIADPFPGASQFRLTFPGN